MFTESKIGTFCLKVSMAQMCGPYEFTMQMMNACYDVFMYMCIQKLDRLQLRSVDHWAIFTKLYFLSLFTHMLGEVNAARVCVNALSFTVDMPCQELQLLHKHGFGVSLLCPRSQDPH